jgi:ferric-dicitrate binding protein FerR (iron transport regulator)/tetratricopeptide (TPR) repeat protein
MSADNFDDIAEQNLANLLSQAYQPETLDPAFTQRVEAKMLEAARAAQAPQVAPVKPLFLSVRQRLAWVAAVAALVAGIVWLHSIFWRTAPSSGQDELASPLPERLIARPRTAPLRFAPLGVGKTVTTNPGERRRLALPDGSILLLNQASEVTLEADRRLSLQRGEIFVEVAPQGARQRFSVKTPDREIVAHGTRFNVRTEKVGTGVVVTQGKVAISGCPELLEAGQQLEPAQSRPEPAPRAPHVLAWARELLEADAPLIPPSDYLGGALVARGTDGRDVRLRLRKFHVDVHIEDGFARTTIDQTYFNPAHSRTEGTFFFPLPADASLSRLAMYVADGSDAHLREGGMVERNYGRNVYETIVNSMRDPALLEWVDGSTFKMRVFPLEGRQEKRIILSYTQRLESLYGQQHYRFPAGHTLDKIGTWSFQARIRHGANMMWNSDSHELSAARQAGDLLLFAEARDMPADRDIALHLFDSSAAAAPEPARFSSFEQDGQRYLMLRFRPELPQAESAKSTSRGRHFVFLFEASADRDPLVARAQIEIIRAFLENVEHDDSFALVAANTRVAKFRSGAVLATPENIAQAVAFLERRPLIGALDLANALREAAKLRTEGRDTYLVHVGTGIGAMGERREDELARRIPAGVRYVGIGVGKRWSRGFMKAAAETSGGAFTQINPNEPLAWRALEVYSALMAPRVLGVRVSENSGKVAFLNQVGTLAQGEELCAVARLDAKAPLPETLVVSGQLEGKEYRRELKVERVSTDAGYLPRTWARLEIDRLLAEDAQKHREAIVALSKAMYVMSPFTSLLVLENDKMYEEYKVDRGRTDHWALYACPPKIAVVHEPDPTRAVDGTGPVAGRLTEEQVLSTILLRVPTPLLRWPGQNVSGERVVSALHYFNGRASTAPQAVRIKSRFSSDFDPFVDDDAAAAGMTWLLVHQAVDGEGLDGRWDRDRGAVDFILSHVGAGQDYRRRISEEGEFGSHHFWGVKAHFRNVARDPSARTSPDGKPLSTYIGNWRASSAPPRLGLTAPEFDVTGGVFYERGPARVGQIIIAGNEVPPPPPLFADPNDEPPLQFPPAAVWKQVTNRRYHDNANDASWSFNRAWPSISHVPVPNRPSVTGIDGMLERGKRAMSVSITADKAVGFFIVPGSRVDVVHTRSGQSKVILEDKLVRAIDLYTARPEDRPGMANSTATLELDNTQEVLTLAEARDRGTISLVMRSPDESQPRKRVAYDEQLALAAFVARFQRTKQSYARPTFNDDDRVFYDLLAHAPGMNTSLADVLAALEAELPKRDEKPGRIDLAARKLVDQARKAGFRRSGDTVFDAHGHYVIERTLPLGLRERVICDGTTIWHLYPELGIGARRKVSRFHEAAFLARFPWLVPSADELARDADVTCEDGETVVLTPRDIASKKDGGGKPVPYLTVHLVFTEGRLAEHRVVRMPENKLIARETYSLTGLVVDFDGDGKELSCHDCALKPAAAPEPKADTGLLVVLPLPWRTEEQVRRAYQIKADQPLAGLGEEAALALLGSAVAGHQNQQALRVARECFHDNYRRRPGFYTLLAAAGVNLDERRLYLGERARQGEAAPALETIAQSPDPYESVLLEHPRAPLARYLAYFSNPELRKKSDYGEMPGFPAGLLKNLADFRVVYKRWQHVSTRHPQNAERPAEIRRAFDFIRRDPTGVLSWALLESLPELRDLPEFGRSKAEAFAAFEKIPAFNYIARYERARALAQADPKSVEPGRLFLKLYEETFDAGVLPPFDEAFSRTLGGDRFRERMHETARKLIEKRQRVLVVTLAWQFSRVGFDLGGLVQMALADTKGSERLAIALAAISYYQEDNPPLAEAILHDLLKDERIAQLPALWRLAGRLASKRTNEEEMIRYWEKALELEYQRLPETIDLNDVRTSYGMLMTYYEKLAAAQALVHGQLPADIVARVLRTTDRWRELDRDQAMQVCDRAARIFKQLGERELAWDYVTTPIAMAPSESGPWLQLANALSKEGERELADRAFVAAFETEPTNPSILYDRATNLEADGKHTAARAVFRRIAEGDWQPRFKWVQESAKRELGRN